MILDATTKEAKPQRAAQYLRMSTNLQECSIPTQIDAIASYAARRNITIVRTYKDEGRSGLLLNRRPALKALIGEVLLRQADFDRILVYDVSRWGRFQNSDEGAHYEFLCKEAGVHIEYCSEEFSNDGSFLSSLMKNLKRVMAGEYSRELSSKVFNAQSRLNAMGFRQGGAPGYALRRLLLDQEGQPKGVLNFGERKHLQSDRVVLLPGPGHEVSIVRGIFNQFVVEQKPESQIARELNREGIPNRTGRSWTRQSVRYVLSNENYIGTNIYNRHTCRLGGQLKKNPEELWNRAANAFEAIVDPELFWSAQNRITQQPKQRRTSLSKNEMLARLRSLLQRKGRLSAALICAARDVPEKSTYAAHFGNLTNAYKLIGYSPNANLKYMDHSLFLAAKFRKAAVDLVNLVEQCGGVAVYDEDAERVTINGAITVSIYIARCGRAPNGGLTWKVRRRRDLRGDWIVALRTDLQCRRVMDYLLLPVVGFPKIHAEFSDRNRSRLIGSCFTTLDAVFHAILESPGREYIRLRPRRSR